VTIAGLYLSPEGVVLGADSTSSVPSAQGGALHFFDFTQKVFEIGEGGTMGLITWGLGGLGDLSYRTLLALLADELLVKPAESILDVANRWIERFWDSYEASDLVKRYRLLEQKGAHDPNAPQSNARTEQEEGEFQNLNAAVGVGFCIAGYVLPSRTPVAVAMRFHPTSGKPAPQAVTPHSLSWWGVPNFLNRLLFGIDPSLLEAVLASGKWNGSKEDLQALVNDHTIAPAVLPIRDAIDYVYSCIHCTIKAMKFSPLPQVCGGPIEVAVITTDRKFRWVRHKKWDAAITDGEL